MTNNPKQLRRLVLRANELFHDAEGAGYAHVHPEIFSEERKRWEKLLSTFIPDRHRQWTFFDIGAGTGFIGIMLQKKILPDDTLVCADISDNMLQHCAKTLPSLLRGVILCRKMHDEDIPADDRSADVVTMNSVLHHIPDTERILRETYRILRPGGLLFIGHEPNKLFVESILRRQSNFLHHLTLKRIAAAILKVTGLYTTMVGKKSNPLTDKVNEKLLTEGLIDDPLSPHELSALIDIHSPTAGGVHRERGFDAYQLLKNTGFETLHIETYNHLGKESSRLLLRWYDRLMRFMMPTCGSIFFTVARKKI